MEQQDGRTRSGTGGIDGELKLTNCEGLRFRFHHRFLAPFAIGSSMAGSDLRDEFFRFGDELCRVGITPQIEYHIGDAGFLIFRHPAA
jgi:hypothetical protein